MCYSSKLYEKEYVTESQARGAGGSLASAVTRFCVDYSGASSERRGDLAAITPFYGAML